MVTNQSSSSSPLVSVVIPVHNPGSYLAAALDSVRQQSFKDYEVIVVDDGSTEDIASVCEQFTDVRVIKQQRSGPSAARNTGIINSSSEFIAFLDQDDLWQSTKLERQIQAINHDPSIGVCHTNLACVNQLGQQIGSFSVDRTYSGKDFVVHSLTEPVRKSYPSSGILTCSAVLIRRTVLAVTGLFDPDLPVCADTDLWLKIGMHYNFAFVTSCETFYRLHDRNLSTTDFAEQDIWKLHDRYHKYKKQSGDGRAALIVDKIIAEAPTHSAARKFDACRRSLKERNWSAFICDLCAAARCDVVFVLRSLRVWAKLRMQQLGLVDGELEPRGELQGQPPPPVMLSDVAVNSTVASASKKSGQSVTRNAARRGAGHMLECMEWNGDHARFKDLLFRIKPFSAKKWNLGDRYFRLFKSQGLLDQFQSVFDALPDFQPQNILEIGMLDGGSLALWSEVFPSAKIVGIDLEADRGDSEYFKWYVKQRGRQDKIKTYWGTDQTDTDALLNICRKEFDQPIDLIVDDASHYYEQTKASFEFLFPKLRPGGLYIIEDWAWYHWAAHHDDLHFDGKRPLTQLVFELTEAVGSTGGSAFASVHVKSGLVAVERGTEILPKDRSLPVTSCIERRPSAQSADGGDGGYLNLSLPSKSKFDRMHRIDWNQTLTDPILANIRKALENPVIDGKQFPRCPDAALQVRLNGASGDPAFLEAFPFYKRILGYAKVLGIDVDENTRVLDFGCGWGRHMHYFWQIVKAENLYGTDIDPNLVELCSQLFPSGNFVQNFVKKPMPLEKDFFDIVWSYSVFSHLNEDAHMICMRDICRVLRPGGMFIGTTEGANFIDFCASFRDKTKIENDWHENLGRVFKSEAEVEACKRRYEQGEFQFFQSYNHGPNGYSAYGEAIVPKHFFEKHWTDRFRIVDFYDPCMGNQQAVIVAQKL